LPADQLICSQAASGKFVQPELVIRLGRGNLVWCPGTTGPHLSYRLTLPLAINQPSCVSFEGLRMANCASGSSSGSIRFPSYPPANRATFCGSVDNQFDDGNFTHIPHSMWCDVMWWFCVWLGWVANNLRWPCPDLRYNWNNYVFTAFLMSPFEYAENRFVGGYNFDGDST